MSRSASPILTLQLLFSIEQRSLYARKSPHPARPRACQTQRPRVNEAGVHGGMDLTPRLCLSPMARDCGRCHLRRQPPRVQRRQRRKVARAHVALAKLHQQQTAHAPAQLLVPRRCRNKLRLDAVSLDLSSPQMRLRRRQLGLQHRALVNKLHLTLRRHLHLMLRALQRRSALHLGRPPTADLMLGVSKVGRHDLQSMFAHVLGEQHAVRAPPPRNTLTPRSVHALAQLGSDLGAGRRRRRTTAPHEHGSAQGAMSQYVPMLMRQLAQPPRRRCRRSHCRRCRRRRCCLLPPDVQRAHEAALEARHERESTAPRQARARAGWRSSC
eukprot:4289669-Pleurochrysis_carterae.AAC.1